MKPSDGIALLVVDDDETNRLIVSEFLFGQGYCLEEAPDGERAWQVLQEAPERFDAILLDRMMPGIDGIEATRRIRRFEGEAGQLPIIALTANVLAHQRQDYLNAGMNAVVAKPISPNTLLTEIARLAGAYDDAA